MLSYYPYRFVQKVEDASSDLFLKYKLLYTFKSPKSHQWYWVWVEVYDSNFYAIKFHLKAHRYSDNKYNLLTGFNEVRPVINTCIAILLEIYKGNPCASFGFIGANMQNESIVNTKRFRVYRRFMATYFNENSFEHFFNIKKSTYIMISKKEIETNSNLLDELEIRFSQMYPYFD